LLRDWVRIALWIQATEQPSPESKLSTSVSTATSTFLVANVPVRVDVWPWMSFAVTTIRYVVSGCRPVRRIVRCSENAGSETCVPTPGAAICDGAPPSFAASTVTEAGTEVLTSTVADDAVGCTSALAMHWTLQPAPAETVPGPVAAPALPAAAARTRTTSARAVRSMVASRSWAARVGTTRSAACSLRDPRRSRRRQPRQTLPVTTAVRIA
jgi:hypothetical protein